MQEIERPPSPLPELTPREKVIEEIKAGKYKLRKVRKSFTAYTRNSLIVT
jgi:hypothetical protein